MDAVQGVVERRKAARTYRYSIESKWNLEITL